MQNDYFTFSQWVRQRRQELHLTQQQLGALSCCAAETIRKIEADLRRPSPKVALLIAQALQLPLEVYPAFLRGARGETLDLPVTFDSAARVTTTTAGSLAQAHLSNFPGANSSIIGRDSEIMALGHMLSSGAPRLMTLIGPGGVGKTRLAIAAAEEMGRHTSPDGRYFVSLASIVDPALVLPTLAQTLDIKETPGKPLLAAVQRFLRDKAVLLVLDNFEHVLLAGMVVAELLHSAPRLTVLVTSRAPLHLIGEHVYEVHPLSVPTNPEADLSIMSQYNAVRLFIERAQAVKADFQFNDGNVLAVADICARLDGLPLAIELAAARIKILPPQALLSRLGKRLQILTGGAHDLPRRHQTLRDTIDWSYSLLDQAEQTLFAHLAVFVGSFSLEAAEALHTAIGSVGVNVLDGIQSLVDKSMLQQVDATRLGMLETIHEYALERLEERSDLHPVQRAHALYYLGLAEAAVPKLTGVEQRIWLDYLEAEYDNIRAALRWTLECQEKDAALRLCIALARFWWTRGYFQEGRSWLAQTIELSTVVEDTLYARGLYWLAILAKSQGDYEAAQQVLSTSLTLTQHAGDHYGIGMALNALGAVANAIGEHGRARRWYEEGLVLYRTLGDQERVATLLNNLGFTTLIQQDYEQADMLLEESLQLSRKLQDGQGMAFALNNLGLVALRQGNTERAYDLLTESLARFWALRDQRNSAEGLESLSELMVAQGKLVRAVRLLAAAGELRASIGAPRNMHEQRKYEMTLVHIRALLTEDEIVTAWAAGVAMSVEESIEYALYRAD